MCNIGLCCLHRTKHVLTPSISMHSKIAQFPNKVMYGGRLKSHESVASRLLRDLPGLAVSDAVDKEALEMPVVFFDTAGCEFFERAEGDGDEGSKCNENEAEVVRRWVDELVINTVHF